MPVLVVLCIVATCMSLSNLAFREVYEDFDYHVLNQSIIPGKHASRFIDSGLYSRRNLKKIHFFSETYNGKCIKSTIHLSLDTPSLTFTTMASFGGHVVTITSLVNNQPLDLAWQDTADFTPIINDNANGGINQKVTFWRKISLYLNRAHWSVLLNSSGPWFSNQMLHSGFRALWGPLYPSQMFLRRVRIGTRLSRTAISIRVFLLRFGLVWATLLPFGKPWANSSIPTLNDFIFASQLCYCGSTSVDSLEEKWHRNSQSCKWWS